MLQLKRSVIPGSVQVQPFCENRLLLKRTATTRKITNIDNRYLETTREIMTTHTQWKWVIAAVTALLIGACGGSSDTTPDTTPDVVEPDTTPDVVPDTAPDTAPETTTPDAEPDTAPDVVDPATCISDDDCTVTQYDAIAINEDECYLISDACPVCAQWAVTKAVHEERVAAWDQYCAEWYNQNPCPDPGCSDPGTPVCEDGTCTLNPAPPVQCDVNVSCDQDPPKCPEPLVPVNKNGCWGCAYADTCTCSDGSDITCTMQSPICPGDLELAVQGGCYLCVNAATCEPQGTTSTDPCVEKGECTITEYTSMVTSLDDCYCLSCPWSPASTTVHEERKAAWEQHCKNKECPDISGCIPPGLATCAEGFCALDATPSNLCDEGASTVCGSQLGLDPDTLFDCNNGNPAALESCPMGCQDGTVTEPAECVAASCPTDVQCDTDPPNCEAPMMAVDKGGCWGCGYVETCTCSQATTVDCKLPEPTCDEGTELAIQYDDNGKTCYACVDPITCIEPDAGTGDEKP